MTAGPRGDILLKDLTYLEHLAAFDRERVPERVVHAKGSGAFGEFVVTRTDFSGVCKASLFDSVGKVTKVAVRFSTVGGESGSADTVRDPRGFAIKFYTDEGNWDLVCNNTPIFFIRDPILFPAFIHTQKRNPVTHLKDPDAMWDFWSLRPESLHQVAFLFSDRGIPDGFRYMHGYGSHTFKVVDREGRPSYVKFHLRCDQGIRNLPVEKAGELAGSDPDYAIRDLFAAIERRDFPSWTFCVQVMSYEQAGQVSFNPFDVTKVWPHGEFPLHEVGRLTLTRNPMDYFTEIEQLAFAPSHLVPGVEPSPDKMLQGRLFSYKDTHFHRLGVNYLQIPVNRPIVPVHNYQRDGSMRMDKNHAAYPNYFPNSSADAPVPDVERAMWYKDRFAPDISIERFESGEEDNYSQVRTFVNKVLSDDERDRLAKNIACSLATVVSKEVRERALKMFRSCDENLGAMVTEELEDACKGEMPPAMLSEANKGVVAGEGREEVQECMRQERAQ